MILTRCSYCGTVFRVTPEQLRMRNGQVRCGHCDAVFNALDFLEEETDESALLKKSFSNHIPAVPVPTLEPATHGVQTFPTQNPIRNTVALTDTTITSDEDDVYDASGHLSSVASPMIRRRMPGQPPAPADLPANSQTTSGEPDFRNWGNERTVFPSALDQGLSGFAKPSGPTWPFSLLGVLLSMLLAGQVLLTYRTPLASQSALFATLYQALGIPVPLPRLTELVAIDSTDLQADQANNQLVLLATLRNQATFNQAWPSLELTLMDATNQVISRRVLQSADYLAVDAPPVLAARSELSLRLRISAEGLNAANYRLYVFYP